MGNPILTYHDVTGDVTSSADVGARDPLKNYPPFQWHTLPCLLRAANIQLSTSFSSTSSLWTELNKARGIRTHVQPRLSRSHQSYLFVNLVYLRHVEGLVNSCSGVTWSRSHQSYLFVNLVYLRHVEGLVNSCNGVTWVGEGDTPLLITLGGESHYFLKCTVTGISTRKLVWSRFCDCFVCYLLLCPMDDQISTCWKRGKVSDFCAKRPGLNPRVPAQIYLIAKPFLHL
ncbi:unnamed protein product [Timema podura]|uniref:Uncharacterized protein n=1 Tax=Timema podura TaxID=61482 RepID=A0ABN7P6G0_TIMPD|nr:unnamed protein product [Timema podura]